MKCEICGQDVSAVCGVDACGKCREFIKFHMTVCADLVEERDSESKWAAQYKRERDEARAALREAMDSFMWVHNPPEEIMQKWRTAAGLE